MFLLIPGMWHGAWAFERLLPRLQSAGQPAVALSLSGLGERASLRSPSIDLETHLQDITRAIESGGLQDVIMVGHSIGGSLAPAAAARVPSRLRGYINLDGPIVPPGCSLRQVLPDAYRFFQSLAGPDGWVPPPPGWDFGVENVAGLEWLRANLKPHPLKTWEAALEWDAQAIAAVPRAYIRCTAGTSPGELKKETGGPYDPGAGWQVHSLDAGHDPMITAPQALAALLLEIAAQMGIR